MINWLIRNRVLLFTGVTLLTLFLIGCISLLRLDFRFDGFFPREDPEYQYYEEYQDLFFEAQNYMIAVALESPGDDIFNRPFLEQADSLFYRIQQIPGIDSASLGTRFPYLRRRGMSYRERPFLDWDSEKDLAASRERVSEDSLFKGAFASRNLTYLCSYFFIDPAIFDSPERDRVSRDIDEVLEQTELKSQVTGIPYIRTQYIDKLGAELLLFLTLAAVLLLTSLLWLYRTFWGVVVPLLTAVGALGVTLGLMGLTGEPLTILSNLLIPIMFVVAMSDVIHLLTKFMSRVKDGMNRKEALQVTLKQIGLATFLTSLTTAIGFGALTVSRIGPIRSFGLYAAIGVLATFVVAVAILAFALLKLRPEQFSRPNSFSNSTFWDRNLRKLYVLIFRRPRAVALGVGLLILVSFLLMFRIPFDNYLIQDMSKKDPVRIAMHFFEDEMYGIRSFELGIHARPGQQVDDLEVLQQMEKIEDFLAQTGYFSPFFSPASFIKNANYLYHFNREKHRELPDSQEEVDELFNFASLNGADPILSRLMNEDRSRARINSRIPDIGTEAFQQMREQLNAFIATETDTTVYEHHLTGHAFLTERNLIYLRDSLLLGLLIAFILVGGIMGLLFRSWKMLLISMVPNLVPLILTGGVMGLFGIPLSTSTSIVFVISFGIAVDDTIHFLTRYRLERGQGRDVQEAIRNTILGTGKAMILTSIVLLGGFILLLASDFGGTFNTGFFTALTILFALIADLLMLPILLKWIYGTKLK